MVVIWNIDVILKLASKYSGVVSQNYMTFVKVGNSLKILLNGKSQSLDSGCFTLHQKRTHLKCPKHILDKDYEDRDGEAPTGGDRGTCEKSGSKIPIFLLIDTYSGNHLK
jgi:hypothetical protein